MLTLLGVCFFFFFLGGGGGAFFLPMICGEEQFCYLHCMGLFSFLKYVLPMMYRDGGRQIFGKG